MNSEADRALGLPCQRGNNSVLAGSGEDEIQRESQDAADVRTGWESGRPGRAQLRCHACDLIADRVLDRDRERVSVAAGDPGNQHRHPNSEVTHHRLARVGGGRSPMVGPTAAGYVEQPIDRLDVVGEDQVLDPGLVSLSQRRRPSACPSDSPRGPGLTGRTPLARSLGGNGCRPGRPHLLPQLLQADAAQVQGLPVEILEVEARSP